MAMIMGIITAIKALHCDAALKKAANRLPFTA
jgi:hypothetical protein